MPLMIGHHVVLEKFKQLNCFFFRPEQHRIPS